MNGIPSYDTIQRVCAMIHPDELKKCFCQWVESACKYQPSETASY
ncbi:MAG: transposase family protein [Ruminococcus sp.]|nr:transposase family protein [Ruminococcus sp.]